MKVILMQYPFSRELLLDNPDMLFLFEDTLAGTSCPDIRDLPNAQGIPIKKYPSDKDDAFFYDSTLEENKKILHGVIQKIRNSGYGIVVHPKDGFPSIKGKIYSNAPETIFYLTYLLGELYIDY